MKTASPALIALLNSSQQFLMCDLVEFVTLSGTQRWTNAGVPITLDGLTYGVGPLLKRTGTRTNIGLSSDEMTFTVSADDSHLLEGLPFISSALAGALDRARVVVRRAFLTDWAAAPVGALMLFSGRVSNVRGSRNSCTISVKSDVELLAAPFPRNLVQPPCVNTLWAPGCGAQRAAYTSYNAAAAGSTPSKLVANFARRNLAMHTEDFTQWITQAQGLNIDSNVASGPSGRFTADKLVEQATTDTHRRGFSIAASAGTLRRFSIAAKAAERTKLRGWSWAGGDTGQQTFDLVSGTCTGSQNPSMRDLGDGWWRCSFDVPAVNSTAVVFGPTDGTGSTGNYLGVAGYGLLVAEAQLEYGSETAYQPIGASFTAPPTTAGYYDQGVVEFTSGANAGLRRTVKSFDGTNLFFALPLPVAPAVGDGFILTPGCDKKKTTCTSKFNNVARFKAMPYVPAAETAY